MKNLINQSLILISLLGFSEITHSQTIDYNKIILPQTSGSDIEFVEKLVQIAWANHPVNKILVEETKIKEAERKMASKSWLDMIQLMGNINEFNIDPSRDVANRAYFYPRYNVGARISIGTLFTIPLDGKVKQLETKISNEKVNVQKLKIREEVLVKYNNFKMYEKIYALESNAQQDAELNHTSIEEGFKRGDESYERYINSLTNLNRIKVNSIRAETNYLNSKIELETLIGMKLEDVI